MMRAARVLACAAALSIFAQTTAWAAGDAGRGRELYDQRCTGCHSVDANRVGPAHQGVFGRRAGSAEGFGYSPALKGSIVVWDEKSLDAWLTDPQKLIPGQVMNVQVGDPQARADLVAYLRTLQP
jgi:cytochrome c